MSDTQKSPRILISGGTGFIGSHTALKLLDNHFDVIIIDNFSNSSPKVIDTLKKLSPRKFDFFEGDIRDEKFLDTIFKDNNIDAIIHFAGFKSVSESIEEPLLYYKNNIDSTLSLLNVMQNNKCHNLIFSSSATVYEESENDYNEELSKTGKSTNPYGTSKLMQEWILKDFVNSQHFSKDDYHCKVLSLRYFNPIGAHCSGDLGESPNGIPNNLAPYITEVAIGKREYLSIFGNDYNTPDGTCLRDYIHIDDLANGHLQALKYLLDNKSNTSLFDTINLGSGEGHSVLEVLSAFEKTIGKDIPYKFVERRKGDLERTVANAMKAKKILQFSTKKNLDDMARDAWHWQSKHPQGFE